MVTEKKFPLTKEAHARLKAELEHLEGEARQKVIADIATARAHGDLSENAEYHAAREQQGMQEARVREIRQMLDNAEIIEVDDSAVAKPGKLVTIRYDGDDDSETYLLGYREEKTAEYDVLTPESPLGQAILGHSAGETITARGPNADLKVEIVDVKAP